MSVPDRGLWLLQHYGIKVSDKEMIGMRLTDGLYDEANKKYFMSYNPDWELRSCLPHVLHFLRPVFLSFRQVLQSTQPEPPLPPFLENQP